MPDPAVMLAAACQRIVVEEPLTIERDAAQGAIVERLLHDIAVAPVALELDHAVGPEYETDRRAGLGVGGLVREVVVGGEAFVAGRGTEPASDIEALARQLRPEPLAGGKERSIA